MTIVDEPLLREIRLQPCCICGRGPSDPAHIFGKGFGGGSRLDTPWNVVPLCRCCHDSQHAGKEPTPTRLLDIAAGRCCVASGSILAAVWYLRRVPNGATESRVLTELAGLPAEARVLVEQVLNARGRQAC